MDRALLIIAALAVFGCGNPAREEARGEQTGAVQLAASEADPHVGLTCAACHEGKRADIGRASVPAMESSVVTSPHGLVPRRSEQSPRDVRSDE